MELTFPTFQTERLLLRQFTENDLENVFKGLSDPKIIKYYGVDYSTLEETKKQLIFFKELEETQTGIWWAICSLDNSVFYGAIGINDWNKEHKRAEIGFWLLLDFWEKGIISEVMPLVCKYCFETLKIHRLEAIIETENTNSKKVMDKFDFLYEGTKRECELKNGEFISLDIYAKLRNQK